MPVERITIVIDTREQCPWEFDESRCITVRGTLDAGDYSLNGHPECSIERKSLNDYVNTIIWERERFEREISKLHGYKFAAIVVEASWRDVIDHSYHSKAHPSSVFGLTVALIVDCGVPIYFMENRQVAARFCERVLRRYHDRLSRGVNDATDGHSNQAA